MTSKPCWPGFGLLLALAAIAVAPRADAPGFLLAALRRRARIRPSSSCASASRQLETDLRKAVDQAETLGAQLSDARRVAEEANAGRSRPRPIFKP